jgi:hypothetical protein
MALWRLVRQVLRDSLELTGVDGLLNRQGAKTPRGLSLQSACGIYSIAGIVPQAPQSLESLASWRLGGFQADA